MVAKFFGATGSGRVQWIDGYTSAARFPAWKLPDGAVEDIVSNKGKVKARLHMEAGIIASKAESLLEVRRNHKNAVQRAHIVWERPTGSFARKLDHRIHLAVDAGISPFPGEDEVEYNDRSNIDATKIAKYIEYGHDGSGVGGEIGRKFQQKRRYPGKWILHDAAGLRKKTGKA